MTVEIPSEMVSFVDQLISERRFLSESEVLVEGLRLLQSREILRQEVRTGFDQLDAGLGVPDSKVYARAEARITEIEKGNGPRN